MAALQFVGGDEVIETFLLKASDGSILNLAGLTITGGIWWRERQRIALTTASGIEVLNETPTLAEVVEDQDPHGLIRITEAQSILIPHGQTSFARLTAVSGGVTMSSFLLPLERIP